MINAPATFLFRMNSIYTGNENENPSFGIENVQKKQQIIMIMIIYGMFILKI